MFETLTEIGLLAILVGAFAIILVAAPNLPGVAHRGWLLSSVPGGDWCGVAGDVYIVGRAIRIGNGDAIELH